MKLLTFPHEMQSADMGWLNLSDKLVVGETSEGS